VAANTVAQHKKVAKIKRKKYQSIGHEWIKLITMVMHKQKQVMGLQVHPETQKKEKVDLTNTQRINLLQNYNYQINRE
jgi:anthranilate/para-aminobenzoate synthase component II